MEEKTQWIKVREGKKRKKRKGNVRKREEIQI